MNSRVMVRASELWKSGVPAKKLAKALGMTPSQFENFRHDHKDMFPSRFTHSTEEERNRAREMRSQGMRVGRIAAELGRSDETIRRWLHAGMA